VEKYRSKTWQQLFSKAFGNKIDVLETMETEGAA
jgi:hypothetical protein